MLDLSGEYRHKLDSKGRLSLPSDFRKFLPGDLKITKSPNEKCLYVFDKQGFVDWRESLFEKDGGYKSSNPKHIKLRKVINARAKDIEIDGSGRIGVSGDMRDAAELDKEVVIVGNTDHFEIWDAKRWDEFMEDADIASFFEES